MMMNFLRLAFRIPNFPLSVILTPNSILHSHRDLGRYSSSVLYNRRDVEKGASSVLYNLRDVGRNASSVIHSHHDLSREASSVSHIFCITIYKQHYILPKYVPLFILKEVHRDNGKTYLLHSVTLFFFFSWLIHGGLLYSFHIWFICSDEKWLVESQ